MSEFSIAHALNTYPEISAIIVLILGFALAKLAQRQTGRALSLLTRVAARYSTSEASVLSPALTQISQSAMYWIVVLFTVVLALRLLGIGQLSNWLDDVLAYIPNLLVGLAIIGIGNVIAAFARYLVSQLSEQVDESSIGPRMVQAAVLVVAILMGLQQMKIDIGFLTQLVLVVTFIVGGGLSLAFALGSRQYVANLVARTEVARYSVGDRILVDQVQGVIVEITRGGVTLDTADGLVSIPGSRFLEANVTQLKDTPDDD